LDVSLKKIDGFYLVKCPNLFKRLIHNVNLLTLHFDNVIKHFRCRKSRNIFKTNIFK